MTSSQLDLSRSTQARLNEAARELAGRIAAISGLPAEVMALVSTPEEARAAAPGFTDRTDEGPLALRRNPSQGAIFRIGPPEAPLCVLAGALDRCPPVPALALIEAAAARLTPAALADEEAREGRRQALLDECASRLIALTLSPSVKTTRQGLQLSETEDGAVGRALAAAGLRLAEGDGGWIAHLPDLKSVEALAAWIGAKRARVAQVRRTTKETDIALRVDLDGAGANVDTGVRFFDHMLEQVARHGGIGLSVTCVGDVDVDAHHTIEDVCLALGAALREALGDKTGIGRYGFALPMDEARASVWIDLSGRPYWRFDGDIPGERVNDFPVEMTAHCFRSIAESLRAAIHVEVDGENAHHMVEGCFKAFGRALRQAVRIEDDVLPTTKGAL